MKKKNFKIKFTDMFLVYFRGFSLPDSLTCMNSGNEGQLNEHWKW